MNDSTERYHDVPVPEGALPEVYALLSDYAQRTRSPRGGAVDVPGDSTEWTVPDNGTWTPADLMALHGKLTNKAGRAILTEVFSATLDGREASYGDLQAAAATALGDEEFSLNQVRAQLSWIAKYCKAIKGRNVWPMQVRELEDTSLARGDRYHYRSTRAVAQAWLDLVEEAGR